MTPAALVMDLCRHGPRMVGTPAHARARELLVRELTAIPGGRLDREPFPVEVDEDLAATVQVGDQRLSAVRFAATALADGSVHGRVCWCGSGSPRALRDARGCIAVVHAGLRHHRIRQLESAQAAGALGLVALSAHPDEAEQGLGAAPGAAAAIPGFSLPGRTLPLVRQAADLRLTWRVQRRIHQAENLVLHVPGRGSPLVLCAHYDGWGGGAADNAAGVAVALAVIRRLAARAHRPTLRLVLCDAEELGLHGSARHLALHGAEGMRGCVNLDQPVPGSGECLRTVFLGARLWATSAPFCCLRHGYLPLSLDWIYRVLGDLFPSDVHHFHRAGIPSATTFCAGPRHRVGDRPALLEPAGFQRAIALAVDLVDAQS